LELVPRISQKPTAWQQKQRQHHKQYKYPLHDIPIPTFFPNLVRISTVSFGSSVAMRRCAGIPPNAIPAPTLGDEHGLKQPNLHARHGLVS
jgi:hypothetical protein